MLSTSRFWTSKISVLSALKTTTRSASCTPTVQHPSFKAKDVQIRTAPSSPLTDPNFTPGGAFGVNFSDHLLEIDWTAEKGWEKPLIRPFSNFSLHPAAKVLHYAVELFEGIKAFYGVDGKVRIFRIDQNMKRMNSTAQRSSLPAFDGEELQQLIKQLILKDIGWVPKNPEGSLYIRPTFIGVDECLGVSVATKAKLFVILSPCTVGYYGAGKDSVSLLADPKFVRSFPGGAGMFKMGSNYAPTLMIGEEARARNCSQVLWLYGEKQHITEVGTMNIFVHSVDKDGHDVLATPPLSSGLILPGVTRDSIITIAREHGFQVQERDISIDEIKTAANEKRLRGVFGTGTAAIITPVHSIQHVLADGKTEEIECPIDRTSDKSVLKLKQHLIDIQYGRIQRPEWITEVE